MEASTALRRCASHISHRPRNCRQRTTSTRLISTSQYRIWISRTSSRSFASTAPACQDNQGQSQPASQSGSVEEAVGAIPANTNANTKSSPAPSSKSRDRIDLSSLPGISPSYKPPENNNRSRSPASSGPTSASAKLDALFGKTTRTSSPGESPFDRTIRQTSSPTAPKFDVAALLEDLSVSKTRPFDSSDYNAADHKLPLRLRPTLGRTQLVDNARNIDLTRAFRLLEMKCTQNSVKRDTISQKFHVRRGQKRKLVRSARWRAAFKKGFLEECARVRRMKNQGW